MLPRSVYSITAPAIAHAARLPDLTPLLSLGTCESLAFRLVYHRMSTRNSSSVAIATSALQPLPSLGATSLQMSSLQVERGFEGCPLHDLCQDSGSPEVGNARPQGLVLLCLFNYAQQTDESVEAGMAKQPAGGGFPRILNFPPSVPEPHQENLGQDADGPESWAIPCTLQPVCCVFCGSFIASVLCTW